MTNKPVTNAVTTTADRASRSEPMLKSKPHLTWAGSTKADEIARHSMQEARGSSPLSSTSKRFARSEAR